ncbi:MAG: exosortase/archaeosortase family protein [Candidatus Bathyarchaeales archaeon]
MEKTKLTVPQGFPVIHNNLWLILKAVAIPAATLILFYQDLAIIFSDAFKSEAASYMLAIPFILAYLLYRKRGILTATLSLNNKDHTKIQRTLQPVAGILLVATAILLYWHGSYTFTPIEYHLLALPIFVAGTVLLLFNAKALRQLAFPIAFLFFLVPPPTEILYTVGGTLSAFSAQASATIASLTGIPTSLVAEYGNPLIQITRPDGTILNFTVDIACSGIYSLLSFLIFALLVAYIIRDKPWKKIALILTGIPLIYLLNIVRITTLLIIGYHYGENLALQTFHLLGGWVLIFIGTLLLLAISEKIFKTKIFTKTEKCVQCNPKPPANQGFCFNCGKIFRAAAGTKGKTDIVKIAAILLVAIALASIQAPTFALADRPTILLTTTANGEQASTEILPDIPNYTLQFAYRDTDFEATAKTDMALAYIYVPHNESQKPVWVSLEIASARSSLHRWEVCLITYPLSQGWKPKVSEIELREIQLSENPPLISRFFVFQYTKTGLIQAVLYWYESATFNVNGTLQQKHIKLSLIAYPDSMEELAEIENQLISLATPIANYWRPIITWSPIALILSQNGGQLTVAASSILGAAVVVAAVEARRQQKARKAVYNKLSDANKRIIDAIRKAEKTTTPTLRNIAKAYQEATGAFIDEKILLQKLTELEAIGAIKSEIANSQDEPIQTWKT